MLEIATIACIFTMFLTTLLGVIDREVLNLGLPWTDELARFLLIWGSLLSAVVATKRREHFRLTLLSNHLGAIGASIIDACVIGALGITLWYGIKLTKLAEIQLSPALGIPMSWIYVSVPICAGLMIFYTAAQMLRRLNLLSEEP